MSEGEGRGRGRSRRTASSTWGAPVVSPEPGQEAQARVDEAVEGEPAGAGWQRARALRRADVYTRPVVAGREIHETPLHRARDWCVARLKTRLEREEDELDRRLSAHPETSHTNVVAVVSPKGGVGKTTAAFLAGNVLSAMVRTRTIVVDANPDFGTLAALAPDEVRAQATLAELLDDLAGVRSFAELNAYVSRLPSGLHLLGAPDRTEAMPQITPERYGELLAFLSRYYETIVLDLGTGIAGPFAQWAVHRADQLVLVTTPEWVTSVNVSGALRHLPLERATFVLNQVPPRSSGDRKAIEEHFRKQWLEQRVVIPYDLQLRAMLDSGTYRLEGLARPVRVPVKQLGLAVVANLV